MSQHFLLSHPAKTLSLAQVFRMTDTEAEAMFRKVRWPETDGAPVCPHCGGLNAYECRRPNGLLRFRCRACRADFTITSGTLFAFHKLPLRGYLAAIAIFCNEVKGKSALAISRDLGLSYKAAFVLLHKLREAMAEEMKGRKLGGRSGNPKGRPTGSKNLAAMMIEELTQPVAIVSKTASGRRFPKFGQRFDKRSIEPWSAISRPSSRS